MSIYGVKSLPFHKRQILDPSKLKEFADNNFKFDENGSQFFRQKTLWEKEKLLIRNNFSFSHSVFKRHVLQTRTNQGLFGKGVKTCTKYIVIQET